MEIRIVIAGCRYYDNYPEAKRFIDTVVQKFDKDARLIVLSGSCRGADILGEKYAAECGAIIERYPAQWNRYGKAAGVIRNQAMAELCDYVICFWDGKSKGTKAMIECARKAGKAVEIKYI